MSTGNNIKVSFVIPAYNEQKCIAETLHAITSGHLDVTYEIVVVDHQSVDETAAIAREFGARVVTQIGGTVSSVRNTGVMESSGQIIIFLDADVSVTPEWFGRIGHWLNLIETDENLITGSVCSIPEDGNWLERYWFGSFVPERLNTRLGTGHMVLSRALFDRVGGFDVRLKTGEDYDFSRRVIEAGAHLEADASLKVVHRDYPANSVEFIRREAWHGTGDSHSLATLMRSKVAMLALAFSLMHFALIISLFVEMIPVSFSLLMSAGIIFIIVMSSIIKFRRYGVFIVLINSYIYYLYFIGRSISLLHHDIRK